MVFSEAEADIDFSIWYLDENGMPDPDNEVFSTTFDALESAWLTLELDPAVYITEAFAVGFTKGPEIICTWTLILITLSMTTMSSPPVTRLSGVRLLLLCRGRAWCFTIDVEDGTGVETRTLVPGGLELASYPNPFNPSTTLNFHLPMSGDANLAIYNVQGQLVETLSQGHLTAGSHQ